MKVIGIIAEYNPFHNGHLHQILQVKQNNPEAMLVVAMSGNLLQRGEPAIFDKWVRTEVALKNGVDVVLEIPVEGSLQSADKFAEAGIRTLMDFGVDELYFGAEHSEYDFLDYAQKIRNLDTSKFKEYDNSFAKQIQNAVSEKIGHDLTNPNDLLGLSYAKAVLKFKAKIKLVPIQRINAEYHDAFLPDKGEIASATAIRHALFQSDETITKYVPQNATYDNLQKVSWEDLWPYLRYKLITTDLNELKKISGVVEGIENRLVKYANELPKETTFETWLQKVKSKRFTYTRLTRIASSILIDLKKTEVQAYEKEPFYRLLGFTSKGRKVLNTAKKQLNYNMYTKISQDDKDGKYAVNYRTGKVYSLVTGVQQDLKRAPLMIK